MYISLESVFLDIETYGNDGIIMRIPVKAVLVWLSIAEFDSGQLLKPFDGPTVKDTHWITDDAPGFILLLEFNESVIEL